MTNKTINNKNLKKIQYNNRFQFVDLLNQKKQHKLLIVEKLKHLSNSSGAFDGILQGVDSHAFSQMKKTANTIINRNVSINSLLKTQTANTKNDLKRKFVNTKWFNYFFYNNPINLLFSIDEFLFQLAKKQPKRRKSSEFQQQLIQRKKLTIFYGYLSKKQLKNILSQSKCYQGYFSKNFISLLERRLDVVLYRSGLVKNIRSARQLISHKKIMVNNQIHNIASYSVKPGDIIAILSKNNEIVSPLSQTISKKFRKRISRFTISQNFVSKIQNKTNFKNYKKKTIKNYISLLLTKIEKRTYFKINTSCFRSNPLNKKDFDFLSLHFARLKSNKNNHVSFENSDKGTFFFLKKKTPLINRDNFTILKLKPLISKTANSFLLMCLQKNYLSYDRKPIFQHKYTGFINLFQRYNFLESAKHSTSSYKDTKKNYNKKFNNVFFDKKKTSTHVKTVKSFTRNLSSFPYITKNSRSNLTPLNLNVNIFQKKRAQAIYRNIVYKTLLQMYSDFVNYSPFCVFNKQKRTIKQSNQKITKTLLTLKLKKHIIKKLSPKQTLKALRLCLVKPLHMEVSYSISTAIFLYSPQRLSYPFYIDVDLILRSFR